MGDTMPLVRDMPRHAIHNVSAVFLAVLYQLIKGDGLNCYGFLTIFQTTPFSISATRAKIALSVTFLNPEYCPSFMHINRSIICPHVLKEMEMATAIERSDLRM